jgi:hypothetical protein
VACSRVNFTFIFALKFRNSIVCRNLVVTLCTTSFVSHKFCFVNTAHFCVLCGSQKTAIISLWTINLLDLITESDYVYCAVRYKTSSTIQLKFRVQRETCVNCTTFCTNRMCFSIQFFGYAYRILSSFTVFKSFFFSLL